MHLLYPTRLDLTLALHRIAEFYESPYPRIRGKAFTETDFLRAYASPEGHLDYFSYWDGFNVPAEPLEAFFRGLPFEEFSHEELEVERLWWQKGYKYLIATEVRSAPSTLPHELAHARWAIDKSYRALMQRKIGDMDSALYAQMVEDLCRDNRYSNDPGLVMDEIQAYLSTGTGEEIAETFPSLSPPEAVLLQAAFRDAASAIDQIPAALP